MTEEQLKMENDILASEALHGFCAWLSSRDEVVTIGGGQEIPPLPQLIQKFMDTNGLPAPRDGWENQLTHPSE